MNPQQPPPYPVQPPYAMAYAPASGTQDAEHLKLLSIFHYVYGALTILFSSIFLFHVFIGLSMVTGSGPFGSGRNAPPAEFGWLFVILGGAAVLIGWTLGICTLYAGRCLATREKRIFIMVIAGINCMSVPLGTALGVFTIIVLSRDSVKAQFAEAIK